MVELLLVEDNMKQVPNMGFCVLGSFWEEIYILFVVSDVEAVLDYILIVIVFGDLEPSSFFLCKRIYLCQLHCFEYFIGICDFIGAQGFVVFWFTNAIPVIFVPIFWFTSAFLLIDIQTLEREESGVCFGPKNVMLVVPLAKIKVLIDCVRHRGVPQIFVDVYH
jgi:hypothetical protein